MSKFIVGVMGPGEGATLEDVYTAHALGKQIAKKGWVLLTGGRNKGVMHAASKGAREAGGLTIGILPSGDGADKSEYVDIPVVTGMGSARNQINILTAHVIIACGSGFGTTSEIALAYKAYKPVILMNPPGSTLELFRQLTDARVHKAHSAAEAIELIESVVL